MLEVLNNLTKDRWGPSFLQAFKNTMASAFYDCLNNVQGNPVLKLSLELLVNITRYRTPESEEFFLCLENAVCIIIFLIPKEVEYF